MSWHCAQAQQEGAWWRDVPGARSFETVDEQTLIGMPLRGVHYVSWNGPATEPNPSAIRVASTGN